MKGGEIDYLREDHILLLPIFGCWQNDIFDGNVEFKWRSEESVSFDKTSSYETGTILNFSALQ